MGSRLSALLRATVIAAGAFPAVADARQQASAVPPLVLDGVTVVEVERGRLVPAQRVVISGNRIQAIGRAGAIKTPEGAQVVDARGKYRIPAGPSAPSPG